MGSAEDGQRAPLALDGKGAGGKEAVLFVALG